METTMTILPNGGEGRTPDPKIDAAIDALRQEQSRLAARVAARRKKYEAARDKDDRRGRQIRHQIHRLQLLRLVGVEAGVRTTCTWPEGTKEAALFNKAKGTLLEVRRTRTTVLFDGQRWNFLLRDIQPADTPDNLRGLMIPLGGFGR
jgi:hypothetical protein